MEGVSQVLQQQGVSHHALDKSVRPEQIEGVHSPQRSFQHILEKIKTTLGPVYQDITKMSQEVNALRGKLFGKSQLTPQELLGYQIKVSEISLRTELLTKAADSALAITRKLQQNG